jgi:hypothetical protein
MKKRLPYNLEKFRYEDPVLAELYVPQEVGSIEGVFHIPYHNVYLRVISGCGEGWDHVSVSLADRCPTWDEMCWIKNLFFKSNELAIQFHPTEKDYINMCQTVLHIWRPWKIDIPLPPIWMLV